MANLAITPADVVTVSSLYRRDGLAGVAIAQGDALYADATDSNKLKLAIATSAAASVFVGIALTAAGVGQPVLYVEAGLITIGATVAIGVQYVLSATAGKICPSADLVPGNFVTQIGVATEAGKIEIYRRAYNVALV